MKNWIKNLLVLVLLICTFSLVGCSPVISAYDIAVKNGFIGTEQEWLENLKGEKGDTGEKGATGEKGQPGGPSAYDIAVENGFEGTEEEWLESLKGHDGAPGANGALTAESLFKTAVDFGLYENTKEGYAKFLQDFFLQNNTTDVGKKCVNQVVAIYCPTSSGMYVGAGVFYEINRTEEYAYIITNYHVVALPDNSTSATSYNIASEIYCYVYGNETLSVTTSSSGNKEYSYGDGAITASYIGGSAEYDVAVLKVSGSAFDIIDRSSAMAVTFANSDKIQVNDTAIAIGNPMGGGISVTQGVVSMVNELISISIAGSTRYLRCLRMDTSINGGNSGGGLFNSDGELIGICNAKYSASSYENVSNAIISNSVKNVAECIIYYYEAGGSNQSVGVNKIVFGFTQEKVESNNVYDEETNTNTLTSKGKVVEVLDNSIAKAMGLLAGDIILGINITRNSTPMTTYFQNFYNLSEMSMTFRVGDIISLIVQRTDTSNNTSNISLTPYTIQSSDFTLSKDNAN